MTIQVKAFAVEINSGTDLGMSNREGFAFDATNLPQVMGAVAQRVIDDMRAKGHDARDYDINLRFTVQP